MEYVFWFSLEMLSQTFLILRWIQRDVINLHSFSWKVWGTLWRSWMRHSATSCKVAGSIPDSGVGIFHWHNPTGRTVALGLTQPVTEMSTRNISWGWRRPLGRADNLTIFICRLSWNLRASTSYSPLGPVQACNGIASLFHVKYPLSFLDFGENLIF
jgi:hypothetical protein